VAYLTLFAGSGGGGDTDLPNRGDQAVISQVQTDPSPGNNHVEQGTEIEYEADAADRRHPLLRRRERRVLRGDPALRPARPLCSNTAPSSSTTTPTGLSPEAEENLRSFAQTYTGTWQGFIAVPNPEDDPEATYVLTAWENRLTMDEYDPETVRQFTGEFIGRGPENPVRPRCEVRFWGESGLCYSVVIG